LNTNSSVGAGSARFLSSKLRRRGESAEGSLNFFGAAVAAPIRHRWLSSIPWLAMHCHWPLRSIQVSVKAHSRSADALGNRWTKSPAQIKRPNGESAPGLFVAPRPFVIFPSIHPDLSHAPQNNETIARCKTENREASARGQTENKEASGRRKTEKAGVLCSSTTRTGSAK
jgi:hypothetical protein